MSEKLEVYYLNFLKNRQQWHRDWYRRYKGFTDDVAKIRQKLNEGLQISDKRCYENTSFQDHDQPYKAFLNQLFKERDNGIASKGESNPGHDRIDNLTDSDGFDVLLTEIFKEPTFEKWRQFATIWNKHVKKNNKVIINRLFGTCTTDLSSAADEPKFNKAFWWLQGEGMIPRYSREAKQDWYSRNEYVIKELRKGLENVHPDSEKEIDKDEIWINIFYWDVYEKLMNPFKLKNQVIKYGAPGTGKTFQAKKQSAELIDLWKASFAGTEGYSVEKLREVVQFHPSISYEDFIEGLRPEIVDGKAQLKLRNGVFKDFCKRAAQWECDLYLVDESPEWREQLQQRWKVITLGDIEKYKDKLTGNHWEYVFKSENDDTLLQEVLPPHFFIIDEINRAELSRVFGELMISLEYRGVGGMIKTQYATLNNDEIGILKVGEDDFRFFIPNNVYIIGTMNTIDRSVESIDFALRRRFQWEEVKPNISLLREHLVQKNKNWGVLADSLKALNEAIREERILGDDYQIGHSYLWDLPYNPKMKSADIRKEIWNTSIGSLLKEYLRGSGKENQIKEFEKKFGLS